MTIAAEQHVIGGLMLTGDPSSEQAEKVLSMLTPSSFSDVSLAMAFEGCRRLAERGGVIDLFTLEAECRKDKRFTEDLIPYLLEISINVPSAANLVAYAEVVRQSAVERFAVSKFNQALATLTDPEAGDIYQRIGLAESLLTAIQDRAMRNRTTGLRHAKDVARDWVKGLDDRLEGREVGFTLGIPALDKLLYPRRVPAGSLVVIGARPKQGKTAVMSRIAHHFAIDRKEAVALFSLEMPEKQIYERMVVGASQVNPEIMYRAAKDADDWSAVTRAVGRYNESMLHIDDTPGIRISHVQREARQLHRKHRVGLIAVDYLTLMTAEKADRNDLAYGEITKALKNLAKELNCVVLLLTQLNRGLESRNDKRPLPSDSRDTGQIEQDCDLWIGLYREAVYNMDIPPEYEGVSEAIVRLNRHGGTGKVYFNLVNGTVQDIDQEEAQFRMSEAEAPAARKARY